MQETISVNCMSFFYRYELTSKILLDSFEPFNLLKSHSYQQKQYTALFLLPPPSPLFSNSLYYV